MCLIKQRANNPEQKALRRQQILDATRERFKTLAYEDVNLNHVAADIGITKAALYRYFRNKETLFLALFVEALNELVICSEHALQQSIAIHNKSDLSSSPSKDCLNQSLAHLVTNSLIENPIYCRLSAILHTILERNLTLEEATEFKQQLLTLMSQYAHLLTQHPIDIKLTQRASHHQNNAINNQAISYLMQVQQALIGVWHMTHPTGAIAEVLNTPPLNIFKQEFAEALLAHIITITNAHFVQ